MENINYNEKVVIPFLEKKCKDLLSINLVLEAKLMVEQNKYKDLESQNNSEFDTINQLRTDIQSKEQTINNIQTSKNNIEEERNTLLNKIISLESQVKREESLKNNAISEYQTLSNKYNELLEKIKIQEEENKKKSIKKPIAQMS
jgi:chromosome segregation ATPase